MFSVGLFSVQFLSIRGSQHPPLGTTRLLPHPPLGLKNLWKTNIFHSEPFQNLLQPSQSSLEAPQSFLEPRKNVSGPDSGLWTLDSGLQTPDSALPIETRPLQEIIINNHKPKSFSSSGEHPHKDSAWFTKSQNNQCESPHTLLLSYFITFFKARWYVYGWNLC